MLECNVCGEEARPWKDLRREESGWACTSSNCVGGGRVTRYTSEWLRERLGKIEPVQAFSIVVGFACALLLAVGLYASLSAARVETVTVTKWKPIEQACFIKVNESRTMYFGNTCLYDARANPDAPVIVGCNPAIDVFDVAARIGCNFPVFQKPAPPVDGGAP